MRGLLITIVLVSIISLATYSVHAQQPKAKYTEKQIYEFFEQYSPRDVVEYVQAAVDHFAKIAHVAKNLPKEEEEKMFLEALDSFNQKRLKFRWENFPFLPYVVPQRCDEGRVLAHPNPDFFPMMSKKGFLKRYKDMDGRKVGTELCERIRVTPEGAWTIQYQWWPDTDKPLKMGLLFIQVPNTPYQIHSFFPTKTYTEGELNQTLRQ